MKLFVIFLFIAGTTIANINAQQYGPVNNQPIKNPIDFTKPIPQHSPPKLINTLSFDKLLASLTNTATTSVDHTVKGLTNTVDNIVGTAGGLTVGLTGMLSNTLNNFGNFNLNQGNVKNSNYQQQYTSSGTSGNTKSESTRSENINYGTNKVVPSGGSQTSQGSTINKIGWENPVISSHNSGHYFTHPQPNFWNNGAPQINVKPINNKNYHHQEQFFNQPTVQSTIERPVVVEHHTPREIIEPSPAITVTNNRQIVQPTIDSIPPRDFHEYYELNDGVVNSYPAEQNQYQTIIKSEIPSSQTNQHHEIHVPVKVIQTELVDQQQISYPTTQNIVENQYQSIIEPEIPTSEINQHHEIYVPVEVVEYSPPVQPEIVEQQQISYPTQQNNVENQYQTIVQSEIPSSEINQQQEIHVPAQIVEYLPPIHPELIDQQQNFYPVQQNNVENQYQTISESGIHPSNINQQHEIHVPAQTVEYLPPFEQELIDQQPELIIIPSASETETNIYSNPQLEINTENQNSYPPQQNIVENQYQTIIQSGIPSSNIDHQQEIIAVPVQTVEHLPPFEPELIDQQPEVIFISPQSGTEPIIYSNPELEINPADQYQTIVENPPAYFVEPEHFIESQPITELPLEKINPHDVILNVDPSFGIESENAYNKALAGFEYSYNQFSDTISIILSSIYDDLPEISETINESVLSLMKFIYTLVDSISKLSRDQVTGDTLEETTNTVANGFDLISEKVQSFVQSLEVVGDKFTEEQGKTLELVLQSLVTISHNIIDSTMGLLDYFADQVAQSNSSYDLLEVLTSYLNVVSKSFDGVHGNLISTTEDGGDENDSVTGDQQDVFNEIDDDQTDVENNTSLHLTEQEPQEIDELDYHDAMSNYQIAFESYSDTISLILSYVAEEVPDISETVDTEISALHEFMFGMVKYISLLGPDQVTGLGLEDTTNTVTRGYDILSEKLQSVIKSMQTISDKLTEEQGKQLKSIVQALATVSHSVINTSNAALEVFAEELSNSNDTFELSDVIIPFLSTLTKTLNGVQGTFRIDGDELELPNDTEIDGTVEEAQIDAGTNESVVPESNTDTESVSHTIEDHEVGDNPKTTIEENPQENNELSQSTGTGLDINEAVSNYQIAFQSYSDTISEILSTVAEEVPEILGSVDTEISSLLEFIFGMVQYISTLEQDKVTGLALEETTNNITRGYDMISEKIQSVISSMQSIGDKLTEEQGKILKGIVQALVTVSHSVINSSNATLEVFAEELGDSNDSFELAEVIIPFLSSLTKTLNGVEGTLTNDDNGLDLPNEAETNDAVAEIAQEVLESVGTDESVPASNDGSEPIAQTVEENKVNQGEVETKPESTIGEAPQETNEYTQSTGTGLDINEAVSNYQIAFQSYSDTISEILSTVAEEVPKILGAVDTEISSLLEFIFGMVQYISTLEQDKVTGLALEETTNNITRGYDMISEKIQSVISSMQSIGDKLTEEQGKILKGIVQALVTVSHSVVNSSNATLEVFAEELGDSNDSFELAEVIIPFLSSLTKTLNGVEGTLTNDDNGLDLPNEAETNDAVAEIAQEVLESVGTDESVPASNDGSEPIAQTVEENKVNQGEVETIPESTIGEAPQETNEYTQSTGTGLDINEAVSNYQIAFQSYSDTISEILSTVAEEVPEILGAVDTEISSLLEFIFGMVQYISTLEQDKVTGLALEETTNNITRGYDMISEKIQSVISSMQSIGDKLTDEQGKILKGIVQALVTVSHSVVNSSNATLEVFAEELGDSNDSFELAEVIIPFLSSLTKTLNGVKGTITNDEDENEEIVNESDLAASTLEGKLEEEDGTIDETKFDQVEVKAEEELENESGATESDYHSAIIDFQNSFENVVNHIYAAIASLSEEVPEITGTVDIEIHSLNDLLLAVVQRVSTLSRAQVTGVELEETTNNISNAFSIISDRIQSIVKAMQSISDKINEEQGRLLKDILNILVTKSQTIIDSTKVTIEFFADAVDQPAGSFNLYDILTSFLYNITESYDDIFESLQAVEAGSDDNDIEASSIDKVQESDPLKDENIRNAEINVVKNEEPINVNDNEIETDNSNNQIYNENPDNNDNNASSIAEVQESHPVENENIKNAEVNVDENEEHINIEAEKFFANAQPIIDNLFNSVLSMIDDLSNADSSVNIDNEVESVLNSLSNLIALPIYLNQQSIGVELENFTILFNTSYNDLAEKMSLLVKAIEPIASDSSSVDQTKNSLTFILQSLTTSSYVVIESVKYIMETVSTGASQINVPYNFADLLDSYLMTLGKEFHATAVKIDNFRNDQQVISG